MEGLELTCPDREQVAAASVVGSSSGRYVAEYVPPGSMRYVLFYQRSPLPCRDEAMSLGHSNLFVVSQSPCMPGGNSERCCAGLRNLSFIRRIAGCHFGRCSKRPESGGSICRWLGDATRRVALGEGVDGTGPSGCAVSGFFHAARRLSTQRTSTQA
ncbi:hypothetical protein VUR80DRAFT_2138 [Thermomyces stellatus]